MEKKEIKWNQPDSYDGLRTLSQHAFIKKTRTDCLGNKYEGNISLCGRIGLGNGDDCKKYISFEEIESEPFKEGACKKCIRISKSTPPPSDRRE